MPTLPTATRNAITDAVRGLIDAGGGTSTIVFATSANATLATFDLPYTSAGSSSSGVSTFLSVPYTTTASATGTAAKAKIISRGGADVLTEATVGTTGTDFVFTSVVWVSGDTLQLTSVTLTTPAS